MLFVTVVPLLVGLYAFGKPTEHNSSGRSHAKGCADIGPNCDPWPSADGMYRVSDGGVMSTGIEAGWYQTHVRPGSPACTWERLSAPEKAIHNTIAMRPPPNQPDGPATVIDVVIDKSDYAFDSHGCLPWQKLEGLPAQ